MVGSPSLMHGWVPVAVQLVTLAALCYAIGWRTRRWRTTWVPASLAVGIVAAVVCRYLLIDSGAAGEPAPWGLWPWITLSGMAVCVVVVGWTGAGWWRRNASVFAASFSLLCTGLVINAWIGYFPTVDIAFSQLAARPLPSQTDPATAMAMRSAGVPAASGRLVQVSIDSEASGFRHRPEWVYLPPAWFSRDRPALSVVMMIGGEFNTTADWIRAGQAAATLDAFATSHNGDAPVVVFADPSGAFATDTECVNGPRGNAADHLTKDVVPYIVSHFGVQASRWGVVGFSAGGTCALDLAVMHPATFSAFVDIAGDLRPNTGTTAQTIDRLFGGDAQAWASFDPITVMMRHGPYSDVSGVFVIPGQQEQRADANSAATLCTLGRVEHIVCTTESVEGRHNWPFAAAAFERALPWLADQLRTTPR